jgi:UDP-glucose 4-epimerase
MRVLVTGGAGYIGSHFVQLLVERGVEVGVVDSLISGYRDAVPEGVPFFQGEVGDQRFMAETLSHLHPDAVVHFAGLIQVGESVTRPDLYWAGNVAQSLTLLDAVTAAGVRAFVFSSTAAVYGEPRTALIDETHPLEPINPYGMTKLTIERALADYAGAFGLRFAALRYFNAAGAHASGELAERHHPETHLIPLAVAAALGEGPRLRVFGDDWPTNDGTCVRDYVHVCDLGEAHLRAVEHLLATEGARLRLNLGTGQGVSVRQIIDTVGAVVGKPVPYDLAPRRAGDPAQLVAAVGRAAEVLDWRAARRDVRVTIEDAVRAARRRSATR